MRLVTDTSMLFHACRVPRKEDFGDEYEKMMEFHESAKKIFKSCIDKNELFLPNVILIELSSALMNMYSRRILKSGNLDLLDIAEKEVENVVDLINDVAIEIKGFSIGETQRYILKTIELNKGYKKRLGGMDVMIAIYTRDKNAILITNDQRFYEALKERKWNNVLLFSNLTESYINRICGNIKD